MIRTLTHEDFAPLVGKRFTVQGRPQQLVLAEATALPHHAATTRTPFILIFQGPKGEVLPQDIYEIETAGAPGFTLHLIPIATLAADRQDYQSVFN